MKILDCRCFFALFMLFLFPTWVGAAEQQQADLKTLWEIGKPDNGNPEFALAPNKFSSYSEDPMYIVGQSSQIWPYAHPGPEDAWAGRRQHPFTIIFSLKDVPSQGEFLLLIDLLDTHASHPPVWDIAVNNNVSQQRLPKGAGDAVIHGSSSEGHEFRIEVPVSPSVLKVGKNEISITSTAGSWALYDWIGFKAPASVELGPLPETILRGVESEPVLVERNGKLLQPIRVSILNSGSSKKASVRIAEETIEKFELKTGANSLEALYPAVDAEREVSLDILVDGKLLLTTKKIMKPVRRWTIYLLAHSHVDIGYTNIQTKVERDHWSYFEQAIKKAKETKDYPAGAQYKWNVEVLWAVDSYLREASPEAQKTFIDAVKAGDVGLEALYGNELTALCRPEELVQLLDSAGRISKRCGVPIDSAMITDVPGYTWGIVPVLAQSGVKYFSLGPNGGARIGHTASAWLGKPFYWVSPCGRYKVLCWMPPTPGYTETFHSNGQIFTYIENLERSGYPYDITQVRNSIGDNQGPDFTQCEFVKQWNSTYAYPKLVISTASEMFRDFEQRYGKSIPGVQGDFTPYWEDGAGSSARETALNRASAERLVQAEALWAILCPKRYPVEMVREGWRNILLYDEHTWGAHNSVSQPDSDFAKAQWVIKQKFALDGDKQSREILEEAASARSNDSEQPSSAVDVFNTSSWPRTDLVTVPKSLSSAGDMVSLDGITVLSQRLTTGELAFIATDVPALGAKRYLITSGTASQQGSVKAEGNELRNGIVSLSLNPTTGAIASLKHKDIPSDLVDGKANIGLNDYFYVAGENPKDATRNGAVKISLKENGPLLATLLVESDAPGCNHLSREISLVDGIGRVDIVNVVDKTKIRTKEGVHFAFPFAVPDGVMRMDIPFAVARPEADQIPGSCKNWFTVQRWTDVSNQNYGVTWANPDAPLVEVGSITAETPWIKTLEPSQTLYSYVMNNYWFTNYCADQEGPVVFHYSIRPHARYDCAEASRFGTERSQPLLAFKAAGKPPVDESLLQVDPPSVLVTCFKPSEDRKAWVLRLFNADAQPQKVTLKWSRRAPGKVWLSDFTERKGQRVKKPIDMAPYELITLRAAGI